MIVRKATEGDLRTIEAVETAAFGRPDEAALVERLRRDGAALVELVACEAGETVGHILFSPLPIVRPGATTPAAALAPLAVRPDRQRSGVGAALVREGIAACREAGVPAIVVLGEPAYYGRFGFRSEIAARLRAPFSGPAFMALELAPSALAEGGEVRYAAAFGV
jgi:putative acetyltransferase